MNPYVTSFQNTLTVKQGCESKALALESMSLFGKVFAIADVFMSILHVISGAYPAMLLALCGICGFYGASHYKRPYVLAFALYQGCVVALRIVFFMFMYQTIDVMLKIVYALFIATNLYISAHFFRFYMAIPLMAPATSVLDT